MAEYCWKMAASPDIQCNMQIYSPLIQQPFSINYACWMWQNHSTFNQQKHSLEAVVKNMFLWNTAVSSYHKSTSLNPLTQEIFQIWWLHLNPKYLENISWGIHWGFINHVSQSIQFHTKKDRKHCWPIATLAKIKWVTFKEVYWRRTCQRLL